MEERKRSRRQSVVTGGLFSFKIKFKKKSADVWSIQRTGDIDGEKRKTVTTIRAESVCVCGAGGGEGWKKWENKTIFGGSINRQHNYKNIRDN